MDNQHYEMPKWSVFIVESYGNGSAIFECKRATVNLYDLEDLWQDGQTFGECTPEENKQFGGGQWYSIFGFFLDGWETGSRTLTFQDKETEKRFYEIEKETDLDPDEIFAQMGGDMETELFFRLKRKDERYDWDITKDFEKYFEEFESNET
jgi:hypothetical protein